MSGRSPKPTAEQNMESTDEVEDSNAVGKDDKGSVAMLQEYLQSSKRFHPPPGHPVLEWTYQERMVEHTALEFCATGAFMIDGVPHHVTGEWASNKQAAKRDNANRALGLFVNQWPTQLQLDPGKHTIADRCNKDCHTSAAVQLLESYCESLAPHCTDGTQEWEFEEDDDGWVRASVMLRIFKSPHAFVGAFCPSREESQTDTAQRVLWYLQCPGFEDKFEPDGSWEIAKPSRNWTKYFHDNEACLYAAEKTAVMHLQNRLQKRMKKKLKPKEKVWEWKLDYSSSLKAYRATVSLQSGDVFEGDWANGQREAQLNACEKVKHFLDTSEQASDHEQ